MEAPDLEDLTAKLKYYQSRYMKIEEEDGFSYLLNAVSTILDSIVTSSGKLDKDAGRFLKECLYRLETIMREIGESWKMDMNHLLSFSSSATDEIRFMTEQLRQQFPTPESGFKREILVGREYTRKGDELVKMLLDRNSSPFIHILGKPGSGKSTLASLALKNPAFRGYFLSETSINMTYPFDHDEVTEAIKKTLDNSKTRKNLLLIDDISDLQILKPLLFKNQKDSRLLEAAELGTKIITTSSFDLQNCPLPVYVLTLSGLDPDESWDLFQKIAFPAQESPPPNLVDIGLKICQKCENIPAVITITASIMSSKSTTEEWTHFLDVVIPSVSHPVATISSILKLTRMICRHHLQTKWRHCFALCSLIPKDYAFKKNHILQLWTAQEDFSKIGEGGMTGEERRVCFEEFMWCGYFVPGDNIDSISGYKIPYLVAELMKHVAGDDLCLVDELMPKPYHKIIRYASFIIDPSWELPSWLPEATQLVSIVLWPQTIGESIPLSVIDLILSSTHLRGLHAKVVHCERPPLFLVRPQKLGSLTLAAFASISHPEDIPFLHKLLNYFQYDGRQKLVLYEGDSLIDDKVKTQRLAFLFNFASLKNLQIQYGKHYDSDKLNWLQQNNDTIRSLVSKSLYRNVYRDGEELTALDPHQTLESLLISHLKVKIFPTWITDELSVFISTLVSIQIANCTGFQHLPGFNMLPHLSSLRLQGICSLVDINITHEDAEAASRKAFYPSLKCLVLYDLPELKGWSSKEVDDNQRIQEMYSFPRLTKVRMQGCLKLISMPSVPMLESLEAVNINAKVLNHLICPHMIAPSPSDGVQELTEESEQHLSHIKILEIDGCKELEWGDKLNGSEKGVWRAFKSLHELQLTNIPELMSLPRDLECFMTLEQLSLCWLANLKVLPELIGKVRQLTIRCCPKLTMLPNSDGSFSNLQQLEIRYCPRLTQFPRSLPNLKKLRVQEFGRLGQILAVSQNLQELEINNCDELDYDTPNDEGVTSMRVWEGLKSLHSLKLIRVEQSITSIDFELLSKLQRVVIQNCPELTELPASLCTISARKYLTIHCCPGLTKHLQSLRNLDSLKPLDISLKPQERCQESTDEDCATIHLIGEVGRLSWTALLGDASGNHRNFIS